MIYGLKKRNKRLAPNCVARGKTVDIQTPVNQILPGKDDSI